jgi:hypothetical protein
VLDVEEDGGAAADAGGVDPAVPVGALVAGAPP